MKQYEQLTAILSFLCYEAIEQHSYSKLFMCYEAET